MKIATVGLIGVAAALVVGVTGCNRAQNQGPDPANANMAPTGQTEPIARDEAPVQSGGYEARLNQAPAPPPPLPQYSQPACPGENYMWTPGYWAYSTAGYYWTPGAWVEAPYVGALWTPPWWGYSGGVYILHAGYWGPYVGFYGGIDYGFGYTGRGFYGGYWRGGAFNYNRTVMNVNTVVVRNVYEHGVTNYTPVNRISYNGGNGGVNLRPVASEEVAMRKRRMGPAPAQVQYQREAAANREQFAAVNHGRPGIGAARPTSPVAAAPGERGFPGEASRNEAPALNGRPRAGGAVETRGVQRPPEAPANGRSPFQPGQPTVAGRPSMPGQRRPEAPVNGRPEPTRPGFQAGQPAVAARPSMPEQRPAQATPNNRPAPNRQGFQPGRPAIAARPAIPEQRPSPFQPRAGRQAMPNQAPQPRQEHSADRQMMPQPRPQAPAARPAQPEARPAQPAPQHVAPEARPAAPQANPAPAHPEPQHQDRGKH